MNDLTISNGEIKLDPDDCIIVDTGESYTAHIQPPGRGATVVCAQCSKRTEITDVAVDVFVGKALPSGGNLYCSEECRDKYRPRRMSSKTVAALSAIMFVVGIWVIFGG